MNDRMRLGAAGEGAVAAHFEALGFTIEARNWRAKVGEIDLVAVRGDLLVFVEVRTVATDFLDSPVRTVGAAKQRRVARAADAYLRARARPVDRVRFDVVGVRHDGALDHVENAFVPPWAF